MEPGGHIAGLEALDARFRQEAPPDGLALEPISSIVKPALGRRARRKEIRAA